MTLPLIAGAVILLFCAVEGFRHGVIRRILETVGLILIFLFASRLTDLLQPRLADWTGLSERAVFLGSWAVVLIGGILLVRIGSLWISKLLRISLIGWLDRLGGLVLGLIFGAILTSCLYIAILASPVDPGFKQELKDNGWTGGLLYVAPTIYDLFNDAWDGESFMEMIREHAEPAAEKAKEGLKAFVDELSSEAEQD